MFNRSTVVTLMLCMFLMAIGFWFFYIQNNVIEPITSQKKEILEYPQQETAELERQIEQVKVANDPPEIQKLKQLIDEFENDNTRWDIVIAIGDIYHKGAYPRFIPNETVALRCYKIAAMCPDGMVAGMGQSKYIEARDDAINDIDKKGEEFPVEYGARVVEIAESAIKTTPWHMFEKPKVQKKKSEPAPMVHDFGDMMMMLEEPRTFNDGDVVPIPEYRIDSQNVHDHGITKVTQFNIDNLKTNMDINKLNTNTNGIDDIKTAILNTKDVDVKTKEDALYVIDKLSESKHSNFNASEKDTLALVWNKIKEKDNTLQNNLTETLAKQLASSIEHGHVVCSTGKITRIMSTLDGVDNESARPMWAIKEELGTLASKIRDDMTVQYGDTPQAGKMMQEEFTKEVKQQYIEKLGMNKKIIEPLIDEYIVGF